MRTTHSPVQNNNSISNSSVFPRSIYHQRPAMWPSIPKKTRKSLTLKVKLDIIHRH
ncbi:hypothetical protein E2C01_098622 [Portunus trituberculatus]|uniref:Uncharacterized protein n=1 Tax=Portunus trituberculatus TaxID=210409 RepID=A0A5B7KDD6_PORTR|nr:hypothetical protein [Portunus trituberculatus]